jgi:hypothetical protein
MCPIISKITSFLLNFNFNFILIEKFNLKQILKMSFNHENNSAIVLQVAFCIDSSKSNENNIDAFKQVYL